MPRKGEPAAGGAAESRRQRLAAELRANLLKRKALARERARRQEEPGDDEVTDFCAGDSPRAGSGGERRG